MDSRTPDVKPRINATDESDKAKTWKMADISDSSNLKALRLPDTAAAPSKVFYYFCTSLDLTLISFLLL
jgi:hypothetical protein